MEWPGTPAEPSWPGTPAETGGAWPGTPVEAAPSEWPGTPVASAAPAEPGLLESIGKRLTTVEPPYPEPPPGASKGELLGAIGKQVGRNIMNIPAQMLHLPQEAADASQRFMLKEERPEDYLTMGSAAMMGGVKLGRTPGVVSAPKPAEAVKIAPEAVNKPLEAASKPEIAEATPPPPAGFEPVPRDLGAAASRERAPIEPVTKPEVAAVADDLQRLRGASVADRQEIGNRLEATPPEFKDPALQERLYHAIENPEEMAKLTPPERALFDQYIQPMRDELSQLYNKVRALGGEDMVQDPTYVHRIAKGHAPAYDDITAADSSNPITGSKSLNKSTSALQQRKFFALQDENGNRFVVSEAEHGAPVVWNKGKPTQLTTPVELIPGSEVQLGGKTFNITQATTREIEGNTGVQYHKSAAVNTADALVRMREVARNLEALERFKSELTAQGRASPFIKGRPPEGMVESKIPQLRGTAFDPKIAAAFDDFYKPGFEGVESLRKVNQFATASIFWNPLPHIENVAMHWFTGRGFDWVRPGPMRSFVRDAGRAIKETVEQGPEYQRLLKEGSGLVYGGVKNADFYQQMGRRFGMEIEQNWGEWKPYFDRFGLKTPYEATAWWYGKMRNVLWAANDMFMLHRVFELERKGLPVREAIKEAELHIPNYRIPSEVLGSRMFSRILQEPAFTIFSRYHYGQWKSYMNMVSHLAKGSGKERVEALGNLAALGFLMYAVYPAIDAALQKVTGDPNAKKLRRGSTSIPDWMTEYAMKNMTLAQLLGNTVTMAPATKEGLQQFVGKDFFTGQDLGGVVPRVEHATKALVSPYNTASQMTDDRPGARAPGRTAFDTIVGAKNTSQRSMQGQQRAKAFREKADLKQAERPTGPITRGYKAAKEFIGYKGP